MPLRSGIESLTKNILHKKKTLYTEGLKFNFEIDKNYKLSFKPKVNPKPLIPTYELNSSFSLLEE